MPGRLVFKTTPDGTEAGVERMKSSCEERIKRYLNNSPTESSTPDPWD